MLRCWHPTPTLTFLPSLRPTSSSGEPPWTLIMQRPTILEMHPCTTLLDRPQLSCCPHVELCHLDQASQGPSHERCVCDLQKAAYCKCRKCLPSTNILHNAMQLASACDWRSQDPSLKCLSAACSLSSFCTWSSTLAGPVQQIGSTPSMPCSIHCAAFAQISSSRLSSSTVLAIFACGMAH